MTPLNLYVRSATPEQAELAVIDYGQCIRDLAYTNIFAGDLLLKNFGVTRHNRVIFYDYDELCRVTDCRFRDVPQATTDEDEMRAESWFYVGENDVFPETFLKFLGFEGRLQEVFLEKHGEILEAGWWRALQERLAARRPGRGPPLSPAPRPGREQHLTLCRPALVTAGSSISSGGPAVRGDVALRTGGIAMGPRRKTPASRKSAARATALVACGALAIAASPFASAQGAGSGVEAKVSGQDAVPEAYEALGPSDRRVGGRPAGRRARVRGAFFLGTEPRLCLGQGPAAPRAGRRTPSLRRPRSSTTLRRGGSTTCSSSSRAR